MEQACNSCRLLQKWIISFTCLHSEAKSIWSCFLPRTRDCLIPVEKCLSCVVHCLKWDGAFNYSLIIFADVEFGGDSVGRWAAAACGFPAAFFLRANFFVTQSALLVIAFRALSTENFIAFKLQGFCYHYNYEPDSQNQSEIQKSQQRRRTEPWLRSGPSYRECNLLMIICSLSSLFMMSCVHFYLQLSGNHPWLKFTCGFFCIFVAKVSGIVHAYLLPHTKEESKDYFHKKYKKRQGCESVQMTSESVCIWLIG